MKKIMFNGRIRRILAAFLVLVMAVSILPLSAFAATPAANTGAGEKKGDFTPTPAVKDGITLTPAETEFSHNNIPLYNDDVKVDVKVEDQQNAGIKEIKYWVTCDGKTTQEGTLNANSATKSVTIVAAKNNSCDVVLNVKVTDYANNVRTASLAVDIDIVAPKIAVSFDNNNPYKIAEGIGYFPAARKATVVITEKEGHFDPDTATTSIRVFTADSIGKFTLEDSYKIVSEWTAAGTGDNATHTATVDFTQDSNYQFTLSYEDMARNECKYEQVKFAENSKAVRYFAVDTNHPTGTVKAGELGSWNKLVESVTFGLWSKYDIKVTVDAEDQTTPIESVSYYKTAAKTDPAKITNWTVMDPVKGITIADDEKCVIYVKIVDSVGRTSYISTNGFIMDNTAPDLGTVKPEISINPAPKNGIYNSDVTVAVSVLDPKAGNTNAFAGLKEIRYEVYNLGNLTQSGKLYNFDVQDPTADQLKQSWSKKDAIVVDKKLNNSNDVKIVVYAVDNAGNKNKAECNIKIDTTPAKVEVRYDNNKGDVSFSDGAFFKADRTATIVVTERNFKPENFKYLLTNTDGYVPTISAWETKKGVLPNGDDTTHTATIVFNQEGDYQFTIQSCQDLALNASEKPDAGETVAPWFFTIDKTAPLVNVTYDNYNALNGNYFNQQRTATITISEHNFEVGRIAIRLKATDGGMYVEAPAVSSWTSNGNLHTATIVFTTDANYVLDVDYTDKAGNAAANMEEHNFYIDQTAPVLMIEGISDQSANNSEGDIGFVMTATDANFDVFEPVLLAVVKKGDKIETQQLTIGEVTDINNGKIFTVKNIDADGVYRITCTLVDKAGNAFSEVILENADGKYVEKRAGRDTLLTFSVNRDGSTFDVDQNTIELLEKYYVQRVQNDVVIVEINADELTEQVVTLNGKALVKDTDYTVTVEGGNGTWMQYTYSVNKELFDKEGEYKLHVSSKDEAANDAFSDVKGASVEFVVDRTAPVVTLSGLADDGRYQTDKQVVTLIPTDDGGALKSLIVNMVDDDGKVLKELVNLEGEDFITALETNGGMITFEIEEGLYQNVQIICADCATDENGETNVLDMTVTNVSVSSNIFLIFWANTALRWGTFIGLGLVLIALVVFLVIKKKKKA